MRIQPPSELVKLRVSVARIAQAAGVSLAVVGCADDAPFEVLCNAAEQRERGWNALAGAVAAEIARRSWSWLDEQDRAP